MTLKLPSYLPPCWRVLMKNNRTQIHAEIIQLQDILKSIDEDAVIERMGYEHRLNELTQKLEQLSPMVAAKTFNLTCKGAPVDGSSGIAASFASKATDLFSDAYDMIVAALNGNLGDASSGPVADKEKYGLLIKNIAIGSFGFQFQLPVGDSSLFEDTSVAEKAIHKIENIFRVAAEEDDENIADAIDEIPPRAIKKVYSFLEQLEKNKAWCGLSFGKHQFQFKSLEQLKQAAEHLKEDNITETEQSLYGTLLGVLPASKVFEFKLSETDTIIKGKISPEFKDTDSTYQKWVNQKLTINCKLITVGQGTPRYTLIGIEESQVD